MYRILCLNFILGFSLQPKQLVKEVLHLFGLKFYQAEVETYILQLTIILSNWVRYSF